MTWIIGKLVAWPVIGPFLKLIFDSVLTYQKQKLDAQGAHEVQVASIAAKAIELDQREAELNSQLLVVEQGNWFTRWVRPMMAFPVIVLMTKLLVYDKALGQWTNGSTEALSDQIWWYCTVVTVSYFGGRTAEKITDKITSIWKG